MAHGNQLEGAFRRAFESEGVHHDQGPAQIPEVVQDRLHILEDRWVQDHILEDRRVQDHILEDRWVQDHILEVGLVHLVQTLVLLDLAGVLGQGNKDHEEEVDS